MLIKTVIQNISKNKPLKTDRWKQIDEDKILILEFWRWIVDNESLKMISSVKRSKEKGNGKRKEEERNGKNELLTTDRCKWAAQKEKFMTE